MRADRRGQRTRNGQRTKSIRGGQPSVSGGQGQAVRVSHRRYDDNLQVEAEVADDLADDGDLLCVLLTEKRNVRLDAVEQLEADRGDTVEVTGPERAFESECGTVHGERSRFAVG